jgi:hypothetical protein
MKVFIALAVVGMALGTAPKAEAITEPQFCTNHQEYLNLPAAALHVQGNIYKTACALGPGNGGNAFSHPSARASTA